MKKPTIIKSYRQLSDASLGLKASAILDALTGNPDFAALEPAVTALMALHDTYAAALVKAAGKESTAIALKNEAREILLEALRLLGHSVEFHCAGSDS
ncbi:MAG TPA: hypothetical protein DIT07_05790 [Sphingobacteriaceae bacterium]|nr:hypothetical protein [Sphingobacteriaceae bacterium]